MAYVVDSSVNIGMGELAVEPNMWILALLGIGIGAFYLMSKKR